MRARSYLFGLALTPFLAQVPISPPRPPPISSQLPPVEEEIRAREEVVPPARTAEEKQALAQPKTLEGTLINADERTRTVSIATDEGPKQLQLSNNASITMDGEQVSNLAALPKGQDVRASFRVTRDAETLDLKVIDTQNGPDVRQPRDQDTPSIPE